MRPHLMLVLAVAAGPALGQDEASVRQLIDEAEQQLYERSAPALALDPAARAVEGARTLGDPTLVAASLFVLSGARMAIGDRTLALETALDGLQSATATGDAQVMGWAYDQVGNARFYLEQYTEALENFRTALDRMQIAGDWRGIASTLKDVGITLRVLGYRDESLPYMDRALQLFRELDDTPGTVSTLANLGTLYEQLGAPALAAESYRDALDRATPTGNPELLSDMWTRLGFLYLARRDAASALSAFEHALEIVRGLDMPAAVGWASMGRGDALRALGRLDEALAAARDAIPIAAAVGTEGALGDAYGHLGWLQIERDPTMAAAYLRTALDHLGRSGSRRIWSTHHGLARAYRALGEADRAIEQYQAAAALLQTARDMLESERSRTTFFEPQQPLFRELVLALVERGRAGDDERALATLESARCRSMLDEIAASRIPTMGLDPEASANERDLRERTAAIQKRLLRETYTPEEGQSLLRELGLLEEEHELLVQQIQVHAPWQRTLVSPAPITLDWVRRLLPPDSAALCFAVAEDGVVGFAVSADRIVARLLPVTREALRERVRNYVEILYRPDGTAWQPISRRLRAELVAPLLHELPPAIDHLLVVPDGVLHELPFETLLAPDGAQAGRPLIQDYAVSYAPSLSILSALEEHGHKAPAAGLLVVADPLVSHPGTPATRARRWSRALYENEGLSLGPIPASATEAASVGRYASGDSLVLLGAEATEARIKQERLARFGILHFATHGLVSEASPGRSALLLTPGDDEGEDGFLQAREVFHLKLASELVVLSACRTARGRVLEGEGLTGLVRAFFFAGARSVVASLAEVDDAETADFMARFYAHMATGLPKMDALRATKLELLSDRVTADPRHWAPFVLIGEPRGTVALDRPHEPEAWTAPWWAVTIVLGTALLLGPVFGRITRQGRRSA